MASKLKQFIPVLEQFKNFPKKQYTLALIRRENEILLGLKKRGFGEGRWNGFGGKIESGETIHQAASREIEEECGLIVKPDDLEEFGVILFEFVGNPIFMEVHILKTHIFSGEVAESEEMRPKWFPINSVPHSDMWADDEIWYPYYLENRKFTAYFLFEGENKILKYILKDPVTNKILKQFEYT